EWSTIGTPPFHGRRAEGPLADRQDGRSAGRSANRATVGSGGGDAGCNLHPHLGRWVDDPARRPALASGSRLLSNSIGRASWSRSFWVLPVWPWSGTCWSRGGAVRW